MNINNSRFCPLDPQKHQSTQLFGSISFSLINPVIPTKIVYRPALLASPPRRFISCNEWWGTNKINDGYWVYGMILFNIKAIPVLRKKIVWNTMHPNLPMPLKKCMDSWHQIPRVLLTWHNSCVKPHECLDSVPYLEALIVWFHTILSEHHIIVSRNPSLGWSKCHNAKWFSSIPLYISKTHRILHVDRS